MEYFGTKRIIAQTLIEFHGKTFNVHEVESVILEFEILHQLAENPEVVSAGRTKGLLPRLLHRSLVDVFSSGRLHGLGTVKILEQDSQDWCNETGTCVNQSELSIETELTNQNSPVLPWLELPRQSLYTPVDISFLTAGSGS